jgi:HK97 family phage prohead protease
MKKEDYIQSIEGGERRFFATPMEYRKEDDGEYFYGSAIVFDSPTELGWMSEEIVAGAADDVMNDDVRGLFNHDPDVLLGRNKSGTMVLTVSKKSLDYKIRYNPADPDHVRVMEKVKRGDVSQSSFAFSIADAEWETRNGKDHRRVLKLSRLYDVSPVTYPAYNDTTVAARSKEGTARELEALQKTKSEQLAEMYRALQ